jgi:hypothetical protein
MFPTRGQQIAEGGRKSLLDALENNFSETRNRFPSRG